jgi:hypothetical protein
MKLKLFDRNHNQLWEKEITKPIRDELSRITDPRYTNISGLAQTCTPVKTSTLKDACISLISPWIAGAMYHRFQPGQRWNASMFASAIPIGALDLFTIPVRAITWLPRSIYNLQAHPFKTWLRQQGAPHECLHQNRINLKIEGDVKFSRSYTIDLTASGQYQVRLHLYRPFTYIPVNIVAQHWYYNVNDVNGFAKGRDKIPDETLEPVATEDEANRLISNDIKAREAERANKGKRPSKSKNKLYVIYHPSCKPECNETEASTSSCP